METNGYGMENIKVDEVAISDFNVNPNVYLNKINNEWNYDVLFFRTWDSNNSKDLASASRNLVIEFIEDGRGAIFGHDTIRWDSMTTTANSPLPYFATLAEYVNLTPNGHWEIGEIGDILTNRKFSNKINF